MPPITSQRIDAYNQLNPFLPFANNSTRTASRRVSTSSRH